MILREFVEKITNNPLKIAIVGDIMIDIYEQVSVDRISPEFPIPVEKLICGEKRTYPGGAANVCYQLKHFNNKCQLFGILNNSYLEVMRNSGISTEGIIASEGIDTPLKSRFYEKKNPVSRRDEESKNYGQCDEYLKKYQDKVFQNFLKLHRLNNFDIVILSDYNKGLFIGEGEKSKWIKASKDINQSTLVVVDPKTSPIAEWKNCDIFKPNSKEAKELSHQIDWMQQSQFFISLLNCQSVVITNGENGVSGIDISPIQPAFLTNPFFLFSPKKKPTNSVQSYQGAGDCFAAFLSIAIKLGYSVYEASQIAYEAGNAYVHKEHNDPITPYELVKQGSNIDAKTLPLNLINEELKKNVCFTNGVFDILHQGHIECLKFAKSKGEILVVGINSDESTKRIKGAKRPILPLEERMAILASLEFVDFVIPFTDDTPYELIKKIKPKILVKGNEYEAKNIIGNELADETITFEMVKGKSTTNVIETIKERFLPHQ